MIDLLNFTNISKLYLNFFFHTQTNQLCDAAYGDSNENATETIDRQLDTFLAEHSRELDEMQVEKSKIFEKFSDAREWMNRKIRKNGQAMQSHMEFIQSTEKLIRELEDKLKEASKEE